MKVLLPIIIFFHVLCLYGQEEVYSVLLQDLENARTSNDYRALADAYYDLAIHEEFVKKDLESSFTNLSRSIEYYELLGDKGHTLQCLYDIARQLLNNGRYEDAFKRLMALKKEYESLDDQEACLRVELLIHEYYSEKLEMDEAEKSLIKADSLNKRINNSELGFLLMTKRINYHEVIREYDEALVLCDSCLNYVRFQKKSYDPIPCLISKARILHTVGRSAEAVTTLNTTMNRLGQIPLSEERLSILGLLSESHKDQRNYKQAYTYMRSFADLKDSILNERRVNAISNISIKYEAKEKASEIKLLEMDKIQAQEQNKRQRSALFILGGSLLLLMIGLYYIVKFYRDRLSAARIIESQKEEINSQKIKELEDAMQISSMESMITGQEVERERIAKDLHDSLGGLLSTVKLQVDKANNCSTDELDAELSHATELLDIAVSEVRTISQDLQPGALKRLGLVPALNDLVNRYRSKSGPEVIFQHYGLPKQFDQNFSLDIYRIIQELLNNALKHAQASEILIQLNLEANDIVILVDDDGIGFDAQKKYKSMGLENIRSRVNYLKGTIDIDSRINKGTSFMIHIPLK